MANLRIQIGSLLVYATFFSLISGKNLPKGHVALFILGDSLFDPGNNNYINTTNDYRANFRPYGESFFKNPTGRFSDGRLVQDFIAEYAGLPLIPPYLQPSGSSHKFIYGVNFASGGAGALVETHQGLVIDLHTQIIYFKKVEKSLRKELGDTEAKKLLSKAVYLISIGANEYLTPRSSSISDEQYVDLVMGNLTIALKEIYNLGGRKFGFPGMAPLGCSPYLRSQSGGNGSCNEKVNKIALLHQTELPKTLQKLEKELLGFKYSVYDFYKTISERINNPSKYGFKDATTACCGSGLYRGTYSCGGKRGVKEYELCDKPSENFYFDSYHPSEKAFRQFAEEIWSGGSDVISPYNVKELFEA